jgi:hypothetical protein
MNGATQNFAEKLIAPHTSRFSEFSACPFALPRKDIAISGRSIYNLHCMNKMKDSAKQTN